MKKIFLIIICFFSCSCSIYESVLKEVIIDADYPESYKLSLSMVGDALVHSPVYNYAYENGTYNFDKIFTYLDGFLDADLMYYNAETILGGEALGYSGYPRFNTPEEFGKTMIKLGFNLVSRANNHTLDMGEAGILNACNFWNKYDNVLTNGSACTQDEARYIKIYEKNNIKYTLLSYTTLTNGLVSPNDYYVKIYSDEKVKEDIDRVKNETDVILVAMHWGTEYASTPTSEQKRIAKYLSSLGVNIVIGTHPHVIEPIEWINDTLVIYSLGNFVSNQSIINEYERRIGLLVNLDIIKTTIDGETNITLSNLNTELLYTYSNNNSNFLVIPFSKLNEKLLPNYKYLKTKYTSIIKYYDEEISVN